MNFFQCPNFSSFKSTVSPVGNGNFSVIHVNIRSLAKYWDQFKIIMDGVEGFVDAIILTEINVTDDQVRLFQLNGYHNFFNTRQTGRGGGIAVYIRNVWSASTIDIPFLYAETLALNVHSAVTSITVLSVYRPPSNSVTQFLDELHEVLLGIDSAGQICLVGDFNIDILSPSRSIVCDYLNTLAHFGLESCIQTPTREELLGSRLVSSCIDHINIRVHDGEIRSAVILEKLADHYFTACQLIINPANTSAGMKSRQISIIDQNKLDSLIASFDWDDLLRSVNVCDLYAAFAQLLTSFRNKSERIITVKKRKPEQAWLNNNILEAIKYKDFLWSRVRHSPGNALFKIEFKIARNKVNALIRSAKRAHYKKQFAESRFNMKKTWSLTNELRGAVSKRCGQESLTEAFPSNAKKIAEAFNNFFVRFSGAERSTNDSVLTFRESTVASAFLPSLVEPELRSLLFSLNCNLSPGFDGIRIGDLRRNFDVLKAVLLSLLNNIIESGVVPEPLKRALVRPLYKGGARGEVESYRPISILSGISKILEKHLFVTMTSFLDKFDLLSPCQHGFMAGRGTQTLLDDFADFVYSSFENNQYTCALFLDVSKAFDTINHKILCYKLEKIGFRGPFLRLLTNFLSERSQAVAVDDVLSGIVSVKSGVPQGSILSPLLFNLYVNDLSKAVSNCQIFQYADDTVLLSRHIYYADAVNLLQYDSLNVMNWFRYNLIEVNATKTKLICFRNPLKNISLNIPLYLHTSFCVSCTCVPVEYVSTVKYLGVFFDSDLSWNTHMSHICKRLRSVACCLYRLKNLLPFSVRKLIVHGLAYSILRYGISVFAHCSELWRSKVDAILKSILKSVCYGSSIPPNASLFSALQLPSFQALFMETVVLRYYWSDAFKTINKSDRSLRHVLRFQIPRCRTRYGDSMRRSYVPRVFNSLPVSCLNLESKVALKSALRHIRC